MRPSVAAAGGLRQGCPIAVEAATGGGARGGRAAAARAHSYVQVRRGPLAGGVVLWEAVQQILAAGLLMTSSSFNGAPSLARSGYAAGQAGLWCPGMGREEVTPGAVDVGAGCGEVVRWGEAIR
jgi:hypothetical protein